MASKLKICLIGYWGKYNIPINNAFREDVKIMCNLSTGIEVIKENELVLA